MDNTPNIIAARYKFLSLAIVTSLICMVSGILFGFDLDSRATFRWRQSLSALLFPEQTEFTAPFEFRYQQTQKIIATRPHEALYPLQMLWFSDSKEQMHGAQILVKQQKLRKILSAYCLAVHEPERAKFVQLAPFYIVENKFLSVDRDLGALPTYQDYLALPWTAICYTGSYPKSFEFYCERGPLVDVQEYHPLYPLFDKAFGTEAGERKVTPPTTELIDKLYLTQVDDDPYRSEILNFKL